MALRIVVLGPNLDGVAPCVEVASDDASALVQGGTCRVSLTRYGDKLADATVLELTDEFVERGRTHTRLDDTPEGSWETLLLLLGGRGLDSFQVGVPVPVAS